MKLTETEEMGIKVVGLLFRSKKLKAWQMALTLQTKYNTLSQVCKRLKAGGILESTRGPKGGYVLKRGCCTVYDVVKAVSGIPEKSTFPFVDAVVYDALKGVLITELIRCDSEWQRN